MTATVTRTHARRIPATVPRPRPVTLPDGSRGYRQPVTYLPGPPPDRPRFTHHRVAEEFHGGHGVTFRTYADGHVIVYGRALPDDARREPDGARLARELPDRDWVAVLWTAHPLLSPGRARLVRYLLDHATFQEAVAAIDDWELRGTGDDEATGERG